MSEPRQWTTYPKPTSSPHRRASLSLPFARSHIANNCYHRHQPMFQGKSQIGAPPVCPTGGRGLHFAWLRANPMGYRGLCGESWSAYAPKKHLPWRKDSYRSPITTDQRMSREYLGVGGLGRRCSPDLGDQIESEYRSLCTERADTEEGRSKAPSKC